MADLGEEAFSSQMKVVTTFLRLLEELMRNKQLDLRYGTKTQRRGILRRMKDFVGGIFKKVYDGTFGRLSRNGKDYGQLDLNDPAVATGMDVVGERITAKVSNLPAGATQVSYQWQYSSTKTGTFSDIKYGGNTNSYEISEEDEDYYLRCKVTTSSSKGKVPDAYSETIGKVYVFDWSNYPAGSYRPRFNGNSLACCASPYDSSTQIPSLGEGDYASIVFDNELSDVPQGNITYRWFKCFGLGNGAAGVVKELGSSPSLSLSGLQGSYINCEVTLTVNGKSKTFFPKAICNGEVSDGIYVRPRIG